MYQLFSTPEWFNGFDLIFESLSLIISLLIAGYSWRVYRVSKENKFAYFSFAFILVAFSLFSKTFVHGVLYFSPVRDSVAGVLAPVLGSGLEFADLFYRGTFFLQMSTMLSAWLLIFFISQKSRERLKKYHEISQIALFIYLILLVSVIANFKYFVFYLTSAVILGMTSLNYYKNYLNNKRNKNAFRVMVAFLFILFSNITLVFVFLFSGFYVLGEILLLIGFLLLLYTYQKVIK